MKINHLKISTLLLTAILSLTTSCRKEGGGEDIITSTGTKVTDGIKGSDVKGFFLLNEGNMGSNKATIDYFDYETGVYTKNIYAERNPNVVKELGDVGNDIQIYKDKIYAVINSSNLIEVMDVSTAKHITAISIPNCRNIIFDGKYAYVSSFAGPIAIDPNARRGYVAKIDTETLKVVGECVVGYQPEKMAIVAGKLYVSNSGGYRVPNYDDTVSVIDLANFTELNKIKVAINLNDLVADTRGNLYVSSQGNYKDIPSSTYIIDTKTEEVDGKLNPQPSNSMAICDDYIYMCSDQWSALTNTKVITYTKIDTRTQSVVTTNFITDGTDKNIKVPYEVAINPESKEFFVTDATNYVTPGVLYCFNPDGTKKWEVETGDIPAHIVFTYKKLENLK